jgi:hypothetical protein
MNPLSRIGEAGPWTDPDREALDGIERVETVRELVRGKPLLLSAAHIDEILARNQRHKADVHRAARSLHAGVTSTLRMRNA